MEKVVFILLTFLFQFYSEMLYAQTYPPIVISNSNVPPGVVVNIRSTPSTSLPAIANIANYGRFAAISDVAGEPITYGYNGQTTSRWYWVDLPGTTSLTRGYVAAGSGYTNPICGAYYIHVLSSVVHIRPHASAAGLVTDTTVTLPVFVYPGQYFAAVSDSFDGTIYWYEIDLPSNCSQNYGWVASYSLGTPLVSYFSTGFNGLPTPFSLTSTSITSNTASLTWEMSYYPAATTFTITGGSSTVTDYNGSPTGYTPTNYSLSSLSACTPYTVYVTASFGSCTSNLSSAYSFTTAGCASCIPVAITSEPSTDVYVMAGDTATFSVGVSVHKYTKKGL